ncbi:MarR family transcriptional regulator [Pedobacter sp. KBW01]|uniref:MarR family transcriptional regulator n=1 Tax=Pedobacter sp. KBW01 TaxID=2153364 RepID=UPI0039784DE6
MNGVNERQAIIIKLIYDEPDLLLTVREIETRMGISNQTARTDLDHLEALGLLDAMEMNKKTKFFCCLSLLKISCVS